MAAPAAFFLTGTDTGVGKTIVAAGLLRAAVAAGHRAAGLKPVAAGGEFAGGRWVHDDVEALRAAGNVALPPEVVNPVALREAIAPHLGAAHEGRRLAVADLVAALRPALQPAGAGAVDWLVVEGAGGWLVPLNETETLADLCRALGLPVILVVGLRLGCLNHALLTAESIRVAGLRLAGWVANAVDPAMACRDENIATLDARLGAPRLGTVPWLGPAPDPQRVAAHLDISRLGQPA
jgi:dethiobiotin synthetase